MNVYPLHDMVIIKAYEDDPTLGGILDKPDPEQTKIFGRGIVISSGPGYPGKKGIIPITLRIGDDIIFLKERAVYFRNSLGELHYLVSERDTSGILNRDPTTEELDGFDAFAPIDIDKILEDAIKDDEIDE